MPTRRKKEKRKKGKLDDHTLAYKVMRELKIVQ
jgi:hypothetical protein